MCLGTPQYFQLAECNVSLSFCMALEKCSKVVIFIMCHFVIRVMFLWAPIYVVSMLQGGLSFSFGRICDVFNSLYIDSISFGVSVLAGKLIKQY